MGAVSGCSPSVSERLLTSGTGLFVTLWLVRWFGADYRQAVAYTLVWSACSGTAPGAIALGHPRRRALGLAAGPAARLAAGGYAGAHLAISRANVWIKRAFEVVTLLVGHASDRRLIRRRIRAGRPDIWPGVRSGQPRSRMNSTRSARRTIAVTGMP